MHLNRRHVCLGGLVSLLPLRAFAAPASGSWEARVSVADQEMRLLHNGSEHARWPVSTAKQGKSTPKGTYYPYWLSRDHKSSLYRNAPMPFAVFYDGNYAIHGTNKTDLLGSRASEGCVRLATENARFVFSIPDTHGLRALKIVIS